MPDHIGQQIGDYVVLQRLGQGSFAEVYLGQHVQLGIQVAVKVLQMSLLKGEVERFLHEAQVITRLQHPHIVQVRDFAVQQGVPFLVMDYAPNGSLRDRHPRGECVDLPIVVSYAKQIAEALQYAHDHKIIHRDVKPENVLLRSEGDILLSDFGLAVASHATASLLPQGLAGTPTYMAPEQFYQLPRPASDQYALGVMVYEWLCGTCPFQGNLLELRRQHVWGSLPSLHEKVPSLPLEVEQVVLKALAKDPKRRFGSVQAFAIALEQAAYKGISPTLETSLSSQDQLLGDSQETAPLSSLSEDQLEGGSQPTPSGLSASQLLEDSQAITLFPSFSADQSSEDSGVTVPLSESSTSQSPADTEATVLPAKPSVPSSSPIQSANSSLLSHQALITPSSAQTPSRRSSRRKVIIGLVLAGACVVGGGAVWLGSRVIVSIPPPKQAPSPTPTPIHFSLGMRLYTYHGHSRTVNAVVWSPNNRRIASGSDDHTVQVWNATDGNNLFKCVGHTDLVEAVVWSPDGTRIASGSFDRTVQVWDATDGRHILIYKGHAEPVDTVAWSPNGGYIASGSYDQTVQVWSATNGSSRIKYTGHTDLVKAVTWSPDSMHLASGSFDKTVQVWDAANGNQILVYKGHAEPVEAVAWSPDGKRIASCGNDGTVQIWNATDGGNLFTYKGHQGAVNAVAWSPDGKRIVSGGIDHTVQVWNAADGSNAFPYKGHTSEVKAVAWSPEGTLIASAAADSDDTVQVWGTD